MEHEDNAQLDNYLSNRLESLQIAGGAADVADVAGELVPSIGAKSCSPDEEEEWKYIKEVQQSEKQQQQQPQQLFSEELGRGRDADVDAALSAGVGNNVSANGIGAVYLNEIVGNGNDDSGPHLSLDNGGNGSRAASLLAYEEEDIEVIKTDGDFSTNSNTTTSTGEVEEAPVAAISQPEVQVELQQQSEEQQELPLQNEDEDPSSVATTYGTSSLSENNATPLEAELLIEKNLQPQQQQPPHNLSFDLFDDKENDNPAPLPSHQYTDIGGLDDHHSQLNPNAVEFVPNFGSQPTSPVEPEPIAAIGGSGRQLRAVAIDDVVAESPRKGIRICNMDAIAVPDESEFDDEAAKRPHELEQRDDLFGDGVNPQEELLHDAGGASSVADVLDYQRIDHGPETSVDLEADLDPSETEALAANVVSNDIMKQSIYGEHNASIEDILNSVQPLPTTSDEQEQLLGSYAEVVTAEKELLHVEEKEHISQSPSTEELQIQTAGHQFFDDLSLQKLATTQDPMQASVYIEHTSEDAQQQLNDESLLLDTSAPALSPLDESLQPATTHATTTTTTLNLEPETVAFVDITPSPLSSTEEKHLVEETKEQLPQPVQQEAELSEGDILAAGSSPQVENAAFCAAVGNHAPDTVEIQPEQQQPLSSNPFVETEPTPAVNEESQFNDQLHHNEEVRQDIVNESTESQKNDIARNLILELENTESQAIIPTDISAAVANAIIGEGDTAANAPISKVKVSPVETAKNRTATKSNVTAAKSSTATSSVGSKKPATTTLAAKRNTTATTATARPRTAPPAAPKSGTGTTSNAAAAKPATTARKPLSSTLGAKPAPRTTATTLSNARPATAPGSKTTTKATTSSTNVRSAATARKPNTTSSNTTTAITNGTGTVQVKPRTTLSSASGAAPPKPTSTVRRAAPSTTTPRSPTKPISKPLAKSGGVTSGTTTTTAARGKSTQLGTSSTVANTTTTTTITKTFTARPAPKFTHTVPSTTSTTRRSLAPSSATNTASASRKPSPLKPNTPGKAPVSLKPKTKESAKISPSAQKTNKSPTKTDVAELPLINSNGDTQAKSEAQDLISQNGDGISAQELPRPVVEPPQAEEVALLDF
ncbi:205 kDa microtubule-associated protein [Scaptodrosophila lebanonensis]|uniref:205 kDa microtubule-associated protein n=1 Tax=Drosophila lebanonensis TaxID=7225 RepID=A0A6J2T0S8_DROLE|nr:205 kDa microtubule-associated protein [Scaptodrosophila lebanonensis]